MFVKDLDINPHKLIGSTLLTDVTPYYKYENGAQTDKIGGYNYNVALTEHRLHKLNVKISGPPKMERPTEFLEVVFKDLEIYFYADKADQINIGARATDISVVNAK